MIRQTSTQEHTHPGRAHIFHVWSSLAVTNTSLLGWIVTLDREREGLRERGRERGEKEVNDTSSIMAVA